MKIFKEKNADTVYVIFRIAFGIVFALHGLLKLGFIGSSPATGIMFLIGIAEVLVAAGLILGVLTRIAALGGMTIVIAALIKAHLPRGINPLANGGEPATLFLFAFLLIAAYGSRKWSLERKLTGTELL